ncbi:MAG TPA: glycosyltransferase [Bryobacteraceae bacterium]|nr:glycosyltransferase [Bryobacteraceae bacterium]
MRIKILTLSTVYPNPAEPAMGVFVRSRLQHMAALADVMVLVPESIASYRRRLVNWKRRAPARSCDEGLEILRPRWFYPPGAGPWNAWFLFLQLIWPVLRLRREFPFQIIDAHFGHPEGVAAALLSWLFRRPFTVTLRGSEQLHQKYRLRRLCMGWSLRRASRVIAVSEKLRSLAIGLGVVPSNAVTIPNGVDTELFHPRERTASREAYGVAAGVGLIVSVGHLIELKGHHRIIRAVRTLVDGGVNVRLLVAGGRGRADDYEPALRRQIAALGLNGRVDLLGHLERTQLPGLLSAADVFCLASSREGWPNVVHEALACGTPVVATNAGAVPEMIPSEKYGVVVPLDDEDGLAAALRHALFYQWDRAAIAVWGQSRSWQHVAQEVLREIESVCKQIPGG